ncbi:hypothetical protein [Lysinibacillus sp. NPDC056232]|uniref:hypothetical protein n=1 Tax=Lysinibacillus sp. NPDC056232 TaxID=3345756 RepID=UPI0035D80584
MGISVTDETLERAARVKRLIGRPQESAQPERKSTLCYGDEPQKNFKMKYLILREVRLLLSIRRKKGDPLAKFHN